MNRLLASHRVIARERAMVSLLSAALSGQKVVLLAPDRETAQRIYDEAKNLVADETVTRPAPATPFRP